jgi:hypothetical protein
MQGSVRTVPHQTSVMPIVISDYEL